MKLIEKVMLGCVVLCLVGCVANRVVFCGGWLPIYLDQQGVGGLRFIFARNILKHNQQGAYLCGWKNG
nr:hypothetical protein [Bartonella fuyuanensis]